MSKPIFASNSMRSQIGPFKYAFAFVLNYSYRVQLAE